MHVHFFIFLFEKVEQTTENQISQGNPNTCVRIEPIKFGVFKTKNQTKLAYIYNFEKIMQRKIMTIGL
jgi:hypothetical protein